MRTNLEIDDELLAKALAATGLKALIERRNRQCVADMFGKLPGWEGDIDQLRGRMRKAGE
jgi:Arc/MetJ family transcription regulator